MCVSTVAILRQRVKVANLHFLQLIFTARLCHKLTAETKSPIKSRETQSTFELDNDVDHVTLDTRPCDFPSCNRKSRGPGNEANVCVHVPIRAPGFLGHASLHCSPLQQQKHNRQLPVLSFKSPFCSEVVDTITVCVTSSIKIVMFSPILRQIKGSDSSLTTACPSWERGNSSYTYTPTAALAVVCAVGKLGYQASCMPERALKH